MSKNKRRRTGRNIFIVVGLLFFVGLGAFAWLEYQVNRIEPPLGYANGSVDSARLDVRVEFDGSNRGDAGVVEGEVLNASSGSIIPTMVTLEKDGERHTVYVEDGVYRFEGVASGTYNIWAKSRFSRSGKKQVIVSRERENFNLFMDEENPHPYPSNHYLANLSFENEKTRYDFRKSCNYCHTLGSPTTRRERTPEQWRGIIEMMDGMGALLTEESKEVLPRILSRDLSEPDPAPMMPEYERYIATNATIYEWPVHVDGTYVHDLAVGDGCWLYGVDMELDKVYSRDTCTGEYKQWTVPLRNHPRGGYFRGAVRPIGTAQAHQAIHSVEYFDGKLWTTHSLGNEVMSLNPATGLTYHWSLPEGAFYPHTLRVTEEKVWFTVALSDHLGYIDRDTDDVVVIGLPKTDWEQVVAMNTLKYPFALAAREPHTDAHKKYAINNITGNGSRFLPLPYGIDLHPDGTVWYGKVYDNRIGRYDPAGGEITEWETPFGGPRRLRIASDGTVWIPGFISGVLAKFDPVSEEFTVYDIPTPTSWKENPYAVNIHPETGDVWMTSTNTDVLYRFDPEAEEFRVYPLPTRTAFMREIEFRNVGGAWQVCTTYSNAPEKHMPDMWPTFMCLEPHS